MPAQNKQTAAQSKRNFAARVKKLNKLGVGYNPTEMVPTKSRLAQLGKLERSFSDELANPSRYRLIKYPSKDKRLRGAGGPGVTPMATGLLVDRQKFADARLKHDRKSNTWELRSKDEHGRTQLTPVTGLDMYLLREQKFRERIARFVKANNVKTFYIGIKGKFIGRTLWDGTYLEGFFQDIQNYREFRNASRPTGDFVFAGRVFHHDQGKAKHIAESFMDQLSIVKVGEDESPEEAAERKNWLTAKEIAARRAKLGSTRREALRRNRRR